MAQGSLWGLYKMAIIPFMKLSLSLPDHLSKAPPPNMIALWIRFKHMNFGWRRHVQSIGEVFLFTEVFITINLPVIILLHPIHFGILFFTIRLSQDTFYNYFWFPLWSNGCSRLCCLVSKCLSLILLWLLLISSFILLWLENILGNNFHLLKFVKTCFVT